MIELFKHILHLDFHWLFDQYGSLVYTILFLVIFIETGLVIMPFLPGDSLLFTAGLFAHLGYLDIKLLIVLLFIAAVAGDNTNYFIGKNIGLKVLQLKFRGRRLVKQEYIDKTHEFYDKYGTKTIIMARFVPIVRTFAPFVAGVAEIDTVMKLGMAHPMGPLQLADFIGLDTCLSILQVLHSGFGNPKYAPCPLLVNMVTSGNLGVKSGSGFYKYSKESKELVVADYFRK